MTAEARATPDRRVPPAVHGEADDDVVLAVPVVEIRSHRAVRRADAPDVTVVRPEDDACSLRRGVENPFDVARHALVARHLPGRHLRVLMDDARVLDRPLNGLPVG